MISHSNLLLNNKVYIIVVIHTLLFWFMTPCSLVPNFLMTRLPSSLGRQHIIFHTENEAANPILLQNFVISEHGWYTQVQTRRSQSK